MKFRLHFIAFVIVTLATFVLLDQTLAMNPRGIEEAAIGAPQKSMAQRDQPQLRR